MNIVSITPPAPPNAPVEAKVKAATAAAGGTAIISPAVIYAVLSAIWPNMSQSTQVIITAVLSGLITGGTTFYAGWKAKHTPRPVPVAPPAS